MLFSIVSITFLVGLALIVIAILGGGIEVKEIKIPALGLFPRVLSFSTGIAILALCIFWPTIFPGFETEAQNPSGKNQAPWPSSSLPPARTPAISPAPAPTISPPPAPTISPPPAPAISPAPAPAISPPQPSSPKGSWYVMLGSFAASNGDLAVSSAERVKNQAAEECNVSARTELSAKIEGFTPGYVSSFLGPYDTQKDAAADREKVLPCVPDAYIKSTRR